ncbi:hypothetical protein LCGC14_2728560, partial [marine sediment metagenome]
ARVESVGAPNALDANPDDYRLVTFEAEERGYLKSHSQPIITRLYNDYFRFENSLDLLTNEGEWFLDSSNGDLYYKPYSDQTITDLAFVIPVSEQLMTLTGTAGVYPATDPVENIDFRNITFAHATWMHPSDHGYVEVSWGIYDESTTAYKFTDVPPAAILLTHAERINFDGCTIKHVGGFGLIAEGKCSECSFDDMVIDDVSGTAIYFTGPLLVRGGVAGISYVLTGLSVTNSQLSRIGQDFWGSVAALWNFARDITFEDNELFHLSYAGIFSRFHGPYSVKRNRFHHFMQKMTEGGAIHTQTDQHNSVYDENFIYKIDPDGFSATQGRWAGIFVDDASRNITGDSNVISAKSDLLDPDRNPNLWDTFLPEGSWTNTHYDDDQPAYLTEGAGKEWSSLVNGGTRRINWTTPDRLRLDIADTESATLLA